MKRLALALTLLLVVGVVGCGKSGKMTGPPPVPAPWTRTSSGLPGLSVWSLTASGTTLLAGTRQDGVFRSPDGGLTWTAATTQPTSPFVNSLAASGTILLAGTVSGVFRSIDCGLTWVALGSGRTSGLTVDAITVSGTTVLAGTVRDGIWQCPL